MPLRKKIWTILRGLYTLDGVQSTYQIHRLVAMAFIKNPNNKSEVNHKNGIRNDNRAENLEWTTHRDNVIHSYNVLKRLTRIKKTRTNQ